MLAEASAAAHGAARAPGTGDGSAGVRLVLLGECDAGVTVYVRADGVIAATRPEGDRAAAWLVGQQLPVLDEAALRTLSGHASNNARA